MKRANESDIGMYDDIKNNLMLINPRNSFYIMLAGDFNARTRALHDFVLYDYILFHEINVDLAMADILEDEKILESVGVPTTRSSNDDKPSNNNWRLIDLRTDFFRIRRKSRIRSMPYMFGICVFGNSSYCLILHQDFWLMQMDLYLDLEWEII